MKTSLIISILVTALAIIPGMSVANSDDSKYPAASFQPKVIFQSEDTRNALDSKKSIGEKSTFDPKYPATNFEPKILYQNKDTLKITRSLSFQGEKSSYDPKYPAANFEPKVIYP